VEDMAKVNAKSQTIDILAELQLVISQHPKFLRAGQAAINRLYEFRPDLWEEVSGTQDDPYYDNKKIPAFMDWVAENA
jgi:hypothetical protein